MEIILIVLPKISHLGSEHMRKVLLKQIKDSLAVKINSSNTLILIVPGKDDEWHILSNKFNKDLFEKYSEFVKEKMEEINHEKEKI